MKTIKNVRLQDYDYSTNGYYFATLATNYRKQYFKDRNTLAEKSIENLNSINGVKIDYYTVMPDHIHLILILDDCQLKLGEIIRRLKAIISRQAGFKLWQPNYYEHVIRNEAALKKIREYIVNNPEAKKIELEKFFKTLK